MNKIVNEYPDLRGFEQHGVLFTGVRNGQAEATCPWCKKSSKFFVNVKNRLWDCKTCGVSGNFQQFLSEVQKRGIEHASADALKALSQDRGIGVHTFHLWGIGWDGMQYIYPMVDTEGRVLGLRRYKIGGRSLATKGGKLGLLSPLKEYRSNTIWICEGEWDAMALSEVLRKVGKKEDVYGLCGAGNFPKKMADHFARKNVIFAFDHDSAGQHGMERTWNLLEGLADRRRRVIWPEKLPDGFDVRDLYLTENRNGKKTLGKLVKMLADKPPLGSMQQVVAVPVEKEPTGKGRSAAFAEKEYAKWLDMPGMEVLDVLFGSIFANRIDADPLWMFFVAPSGGMKSELLMSLMDAPKIHCTTGITEHGLISGANFSGGDPSLIPKILGKVLVVKDFTCILTMNITARDHILGILRDAYDGRIEWTFGNNVIRRYEGKFGIIAGVTPKIDDPLHQASILGERFIKYRIRQRGKINVAKAAIRKALNNLTKESKMREALKSVARDVIDRTIEEKDYPIRPDWFNERALELAQWVSVMRGCVSRDRYTQRVMFKPTAEIGTRLAKQFCVLGMGIGIYRRRKTLVEADYKVIRHVARDTAPDQVEEIIKQMYVHGHDDYLTTDEISRRTRQPTETCRYLLQDLDLLHVVKRNKRIRGSWKLNDSLFRMMIRIGLYEEEKQWKG